LQCPFVTGPTYQVEQLAHSVSIVNLGVEDLRDLKLWFTIYFDQWQRRLYLVWYGI